MERTQTHKGLAPPPQSYVGGYHFLDIDPLLQLLDKSLADSHKPTSLP